MPDITPQLTAIIALRVSTPSQVNKAIDPEGYSIPNQRDACHRYCACSWRRRGDRRSHRAWRVASDIAKRPHVKELIDKVDRHRPDFIVYFDLSRSARNDYDAQWLWRELTERRGVLIQSTQERIDNTPNGRMIYSITAAVTPTASAKTPRKSRAGSLASSSKAATWPRPNRLPQRQAAPPGREVRVVTVDQSGLIWCAMRLSCTRPAISRSRP